MRIQGIAILIFQGFSLSAVSALTVATDASCESNGGFPIVTPSPGKYFNESCSKQSDCSQSRGPAVCVNGTCKCAPNNSPVKDTYRQYADNVIFCQSSPGYNQFCTDECYWPLKCSEAVGNTTVPPYTFYPYTTQSSTYPKKFCQCLAPFTMNEYSYYSCVLQCRPDEIAGMDTCYKLAALGSNCDVDQQCSAAFSECAKKTCVCRSGFKADGDTCVVSAAYCEFGQPLRSPPSGKNAALITCYRYRVTTGYLYSIDDLSSAGTAVIQMDTSRTSVNPLAQPGDNCPADYYCQPYDVWRANIYKTIGQCCPYPKPACPVGEPHPTCNCTDNVATSPIPYYATPGPYAYKSGPEPPTQDRSPAPNQCPPDTHYCYSRQILPASGYVLQSTCCPRPCPRQSIFVDGQCVPLAILGEKCRVNEQCSSVNADCTNGICACPAKTQKTKQPNGDAICVPNCDYTTEFAINGRCYPRFKIGDQCRGQESRCPISAYCNSAGVCQCYCGTMSLNGVICVSQPHCPDVKRASSTPAYNLYIYTTKKPTKEIFEKVTLCRDPSTPAVIEEAVDSCPEDQFCNSFAPSLGVCCEKPDPYCPYNDKIYEYCQFPSYTSGATVTPSQPCKPGQFCHQFFYGLGNLTDNKVCCDNYVPPTRVPTPPRPYYYTTPVPTYRYSTSRVPATYVPTPEPERHPPTKSADDAPYHTLYHDEATQ